MSDLQPLLRIDSAPLLLLETDLGAASDAMSAWRDAGLTVRSVRGRKMRTVDRLFDEVAAALQFPHYFGENWPAFDECLSDMDWLPTESGIVIVILDANEVLRDSPDSELEVLVRLIERAADHYAQPIERGEWWDRPAVPFHVVLQTEQKTTALRGRWEGAGAAVAGFSP